MSYYQTTNFERDKFFRHRIFTNIINQVTTIWNLTFHIEHFKEQLILIKKS